MRASKPSRYLIGTNIKYYSLLDQQMFFEWAQRISSIKQCYLSEQTIYIELKSRKLSKRDLYDLLAFLHQYKINMKQLRPFLTKRNQKLFAADKKAYWYNPLFGK